MDVKKFEWNLTRQFRSFNEVRDQLLREGHLK